MIRPKEKRYVWDANISDKSLESSLEESQFHKETAFTVHKCLHALEEPYKEVFSLRLLGELSFEQIAHLYGKT